MAPNSKRIAQSAFHQMPCGAGAAALVQPAQASRSRAQALSEAAVVAYQADRDGLYNPPNSPTRTPRIRGVAITGDDGRFRFITVRPGPYPNATEPAHIHMEVKAPAHHLRFVTYWFEGDPLITESRRPKAGDNVETVIVELTRESDGTWTFVHDVRLEGN